MANNTSVKSIYVDPKDQDVLKWFSSQRNASSSIRRLIKNAINTYGTGDYLDARDDELNKLIKQGASGASEAQVTQVTQEKPKETNGAGEAQRAQGAEDTNETQEFNNDSLIGPKNNDTKSAKVDLLGLE